MIWIGTDSNSNLCYATIWDNMRFLYILYSNERKKSFLRSSLFTFIQILGGLTSKILPPSAFIPKRLWNLSSFFRHFYWQNLFTHRALFRNPLIDRVKDSLHSLAVSAIWARWKSCKATRRSQGEIVRTSAEAARSHLPRWPTYFYCCPLLHVWQPNVFLDRIIPANQNVSRNGFAGKSHCEHQNNTIR